MNVADAVVASLSRSGVEYVFGLPGSTEGPLLDALSRVERPVYVLALHENVAAAMADGYARVSGRPGIVSLHTSVGTANAVSQIMNADTDRSPVVAIVGHKDRRIANRDGFCTVEDLPGLLRPYTKWSRQVEAASHTVEDLERAVALALSPPRGPVCLVITEERAAAEIDGTQEIASPFVPAGGYRPDRESIRLLADMLLASQRPVLVAGDGVSSSGAGAMLERLAARLGIPVVQEPRRSAARLNYSTEHATYCGEFDTSHPLIREADLVVALGGRVFVEFAPRKARPLPAGVRFVHLHDDPREIGKRVVPDLGLVGNVRDTLEDLWGVLDDLHVPERSHDGSVEHWRKAYTAQRETLRRQVDEQRLTIAAASKVIDEELPDDVIIFDEGIRSSRVLLRFLRAWPSREYHRNTGGAIGWGLPAAVGACFAAPRRPVTVFVGDGSALMTIQALWTAARHELDLTVLVSDNHGYQAVQAAVEEHRGAALRRPAVGAAIRSPTPDFVGLAVSFGVPAVAVKSATVLRDELREAKSRPGPRLIALDLDGRDHVGNE